MTWLAHTMMGITLGEVVADPTMAFTLGIPTHLVVDKIPHYWPDNLIARYSFQAIDLALSIAAVVVAIRIDPVRKIPIVAGVLGSLAIDLALSNPFVYNKKFGIWHTDRQPHGAKLSYLLPDIVVSLMFALISLYLIR